MVAVFVGLKYGVADGKVGVSVMVAVLVAVGLFVGVLVLVSVLVTVYGVIPGIVAVAVAGNGVLLFATVGVCDAFGVAVNVGEAGQSAGLLHGVAAGISRGAGGLVLL